MLQPRRGQSMAKTLQPRINESASPLGGEWNTMLGIVRVHALVHRSYRQEGHIHGRHAEIIAIDGLLYSPINCLQTSRGKQL